MCVLRFYLVLGPKRSESHFNCTYLFKLTDIGQVPEINLVSDDIV